MTGNFPIDPLHNAIEERVLSRGMQKYSLGGVQRIYALLQIIIIKLRDGPNLQMDARLPGRLQQQGYIAGPAETLIACHALTKRLQGHDVGPV